MKKNLLLLLIMLFSVSMLFSQALDEDFESGTWPPAGWTEQQIGDPAGWAESTLQAHTPTHSAFHDDDNVTTGCNDWLISPVMDLSSFVTPQLIYWDQVNYTGSADEHNVWYSIDYSGSGDPTSATWTTINDVIGTEDTWIENGPYTLPTNSTVYIAFQYIGDYASEWWIDDVSVNEAPSCLAPTDLAETNITITSADLGWTETGTATLWDIEYGATPYVFTGNPTITGTTDNPYALSGLFATTEYTWQVRANCGGGDLSDWSAASIFTTEASEAPVQSIPFVEDWETNTIGAAWNYNAGFLAFIATNTASAYSGTYGLVQYGDDFGYSTPSGLADAYSKSQIGGANENWTTWNKMSVDLSTAVSPFLSFHYAMGYYFNKNYNNFWVQVSADGNSWVDIFSTQAAGAAIAYTKKEIDLNAYAGTAQLYVRFFHNGKYVDNYLYLDDITIKEVSCPTPTDLAATNITASSADLGWTETGTATTWDIEYGATPYVFTGNPTITGTTINPYALSGLSANTEYICQVRADCVGNQSDWSESSTFTTDFDLVTQTLPFTEDFETNLDSWGLSGTTTPEISTDEFYGGSKSLSFNTTTNTNSSVTVQLESGTDPLLTFWYYIDFYSYNDLTVDIKEAGSATWTTTIWQEATTSGTSDTWLEAVIDLSSYNTSGVFQLRFNAENTSSWSDYIVYMDDVAVQADLPESPSNPSPTDNAINVAVSGDLTWDFGANTATYDLWLGPAGNMSKVVDAAAVGAGSYSYSALSTATIYEWQIIAHSSAMSTLNGPVWSFTTELPTGMLQIGNGIATNKGLPIEPYFGYDYNQTIYLSSDFTGVVADKQIEKLYYNYSKLITGDPNEDDWKIWIGTTSNTDLDGGYIDVSTLTAVFDGSTGFGALAAGDGWLEITLTIPYSYNPATDGNIVIAVHEYSSGYTTSSDEFYCDQKLGTNVSRAYHEDTNNPDPTNPPAGTASDYYPNTRFQFEDLPSTPIFSVSPIAKDFGTINSGESSATQTFTISNTGAGTLQITGVALSGDDADQFALVDVNTYPIDLANAESLTVDATFEPTSEGAKTASLDISDNQGKNDHAVALTGTGFVPPQGAVCSNPLPLNLPAVDVTGDTDGFFDDYNSTDISPSSSYLSGDDIVYQFTVPYGKLSGTVVTTDSWMGVFILDDCPNSATPPTPVIQKTASGSTVTFDDDVIAAGTYFLIISSYPSPQSIDFTINLSHVEIPIATTWTGTISSDCSDAGNWSNGIPEEITAVTIPVVATNYPTLTFAATIASLDLAEGATLVGAENLTITGDFTTTRNVTWYDQYHYLSSPVGDIAIEDAFPNGSVGAAFYMYSYDEPTQNWVAKTRDDDMLNGMGYNIYRDAGTGFDFDIDFTKDSPVWADVTFTDLSYTAPSTAIDYESWHLLGNPFPAGLDWDFVAPLTNIENAVYAWCVSAGGYVSWITGAGSLTEGILPLGQGFMVKVNDNTNSITLPVAAAVHSDAPIYKATASALRLDVTSTATAYHDATFVRFATSATTAFDNALDARKLFGLEEAPALYTQIDEQMYSVNSVNEEVETIALNFQAGVNGSYTIAATDVMSNGTATLEDLQTGEMVELEAAATYTFAATMTDDVERFVLHIKASNGIGEQATSTANIYAFANRAYIEVQATGEAEIYNISGQLVRRLVVTKGLNSVVLESGVYIVRLGVDAEKVHIQ